MLGLVLGDYCGSAWEGGQATENEFTLFPLQAQITDDTILACAIADAILNGDCDFAGYLRKWVSLYPDAGYGYGGHFRRWASDPTAGPYESYGNGAAVRAIPIAWLSRSLDEALAHAEASASVTHNHPDAVFWTRATVGCLWLLLNGGNFKNFFKEQGIHLPENPVWDDSFSTKAIDTVPVGLSLGLSKDKVRIALKKVMMHGGDCDTMGAIAGSVSDAIYGIPQDLQDTALSFLDERMREIVTAVSRRHVERTPLAASYFAPAPKTFKKTRAVYEALEALFDW